MAHKEKALKSAPARKNTRIRYLYDYFRTRIKEQDTSIYRLSAMLIDLLLRKQSAWGANKPLLYKLTLAGTPSSGKTETVMAMRHYLGMEPGYEYEHQYIELDGATLDSVLSGLAERLNHAIRNSPPYMMLFIDNLERASRESINALHDFLGSGTLRDETIFMLPVETTLLIVSTYGTNELCQMERRDDTMAENLIQCAMTKRGIRKETIERLSQILPFYQLDDEVLRRILTEKLDEYVSTSVITSRFGDKMVTYLGDAKSILVNHVLTKVRTEYGGIRGSIRELFLKLNVLFATSLDVLEEMLEEKNEAIPNKPLYLSACSFDTHQFNKSLAHQLDPIIRLIKENPDNQQTLDLCDPTQEGQVNAVAMTYGEVALCSLVMNITYNHYQFVNHYDDKTSGREIHRLKEEVKGLKGALKEMIQTVDNRGRTIAFNDHLKSIADRNRELIESSDDDNVPPKLIKTSPSKVHDENLSCISSVTEEKEKSRPVLAIRDCPTNTTTTNESDSCKSITNKESRKNVRRQNKFPRSECFSKREMIEMFGDEYEVNMTSDTSSSEEEEPHQKKRKIMDECAAVDDGEPTHRKCTRCDELQPSSKFFNYIKDGVSHYRSYCNKRSCRQK